MDEQSSVGRGRIHMLVEVATEIKSMSFNHAAPCFLKMQVDVVSTAHVIIITLCLHLCSLLLNRNHHSAFSSLATFNSSNVSVYLPYTSERHTNRESHDGD